MRGNQYHNSQESGSIYLSQMPLQGQECNTSWPPRRNERNGGKGSGDPLGNGKHPHRSSRHGGPHGIPGGGADVPLMILIEVVQIVLLPLNLEEGIGMIDILNNMINLNRV